MAETSAVLIGTLITWALATLFVHLAAKLVMGKSNLLQAFLAVLIGSFLAMLVLIGAGKLWDNNVLGAVLAIAAYGLVFGMFYRASWVKGILLGVVAWIFWLVAQYLADLIFN